MKYISPRSLCHENNDIGVYNPLMYVPCSENNSMYVYLLLQIRVYAVVYRARRARAGFESMYHRSRHSWQLITETHVEAIAELCTRSMCNIKSFHVVAVLRHVLASRAWALDTRWDRNHVCPLLVQDSRVFSSHQHEYCSVRSGPRFEPY